MEPRVRIWSSAAWATPLSDRPVSAGAVPARGIGAGRGTCAAAGACETGGGLTQLAAAVPRAAAAQSAKRPIRMPPGPGPIRLLIALSLSSEILQLPSDQRRFRPV